MISIHPLRIFFAFTCTNGPCCKPRSIIMVLLVLRSWLKRRRRNYRAARDAGSQTTNRGINTIVPTGEIPPPSPPVARNYPLTAHKRTLAQHTDQEHPHSQKGRLHIPPPIHPVSRLPSSLCQLFLRVSPASHLLINFPSARQHTGSSRRDTRNSRPRLLPPDDVTSWLHWVNFSPGKDRPSRRNGIRIRRHRRR